MNDTMTVVSNTASMQSFFKNWSNIANSQLAETEPLKGTDILIVRSYRGFGKKRLQVIGSMRQKKRRRINNMHWIANAKQGKLFTNCFPTSISQNASNSGMIEMTVEFNRENAKH